MMCASTPNARDGPVSHARESQHTRPLNHDPVGIPAVPDRRTTSTRTPRGSRLTKRPESQSHEPVVLINPFEAPASRHEEFHPLWTQAAQYTRRQEGFVSPDEVSGRQA
jgi:hypothetical protein